VSIRRLNFLAKSDISRFSAHDIIAGAPFGLDQVRTVRSLRRYGGSAGPFSGQAYPLSVVLPLICAKIHPLPRANDGMLIGMSAPRLPSRRWTSGEENRLREMLEAGSTAIDIAVELERTPSSVYSRLQRLYRKRPIRDITRAVRSRYKKP
jgi:DNA-binding CsgD family transcriptional regulator